MTFHLAEASQGGEILPRPISLEEYSLFDIPRGINVEVSGSDYLDCINKLKEQIEKIQELYDEGR